MMVVALHTAYYANNNCFSFIGKSVTPAYGGSLRRQDESRQGDDLRDDNVLGRQILLKLGHCCTVILRGIQQTRFLRRMRQENG